MKISVELDTHHPRADGTCRVRIVVFHHKRVRIPLAMHVKPSEWTTGHRVKGHPQAPLFNRTIEVYLNRAQALTLEHPGKSAGEIATLLTGNTTDGKPFHVVASEWVNAHPRKSWNAQRQRTALIGRFAVFRPSLRTEAITADVFADFKLDIFKRKASHNTAASQLRVLRTLYNRACEQVGITPKAVLKGNDAVERYNVPKIPLNAEEVRALYKYANSQKGWLAKAAHMWLFSFDCAGVRWGDLCRLDTEALADGRLRLSQNKSDGGKSVVLTPRAKRIAGLYRRGPMIFGIAGEEVPTYQQIAGANVIANRCLKVAAKACGIKKRLRTHLSRDSFMQAGLDAGVHERALQQMMAIGDKAFVAYRGRFPSEALDKAQLKILKRRR